MYGKRTVIQHTVYNYQIMFSDPDTEETYTVEMSADPILGTAANSITWTNMPPRTWKRGTENVVRKGKNHLPVECVLLCHVLFLVFVSNIFWVTCN